jgi:TPR repeat protein
MINLAVMYHTGQGVTQDYGKAMDWYLKAFAKQNGDAYSNIGVLYRDGLGVETNLPIAYALFYITHMRGLGTDSTQIRAGRNLDKTVALMKQDEINETLKITEKYVIRFVEKRGKLDKNDQALKFSKWHHSLKKLSEL